MYIAAMKNRLPLFAFLLLQCFFYACGNNDRTATQKPENDIDAARNFIRAALDGKFDEARIYLLPDSTNAQYMNAAERNYQKADSSVKYGYRTSSINVHEVKKINDSATVVVYSNSFMKNPDTLRVVKTNGMWLVDLAYLYEHDAGNESLYKK
jgi:hypothetical protein